MFVFVFVLGALNRLQVYMARPGASGRDDKKGASQKPPGLNRQASK